MSHVTHLISWVIEKRVNNLPNLYVFTHSVLENCHTRCILLLKKKKKKKMQIWQITALLLCPLHVFVVWYNTGAVKILSI